MQGTQYSHPYLQSENCHTSVPVASSPEYAGSNRNIQCMNNQQNENIFSNKYISHISNSSSLHSYVYNTLDRTEFSNENIRTVNASYPFNSAGYNYFVPGQASFDTAYEKFRLPATDIQYNYSRFFCESSSPISHSIGTFPNHMPVNMSQDSNSHTFNQPNLHSVGVVTSDSQKPDNEICLQQSKAEDFSKVSSKTKACDIVTEKVSCIEIKKGNSATSDAESDLERVFIWDLDETIIIFQSLLNGSYASKYNKNAEVLQALGIKIEEMVFNFSDTYFFFNELGDDDHQVQVNDVCSYDDGRDLGDYDFSADDFIPSRSRDMSEANESYHDIERKRKLAFRYRKIRDIYTNYSNFVDGLLGSHKAEWAKLRTEIESVTDNWLTEAVKCLLLIQLRPNCRNVLVTNTHLVPALAKVMLFGLSKFFSINNIYSASHIGKSECFARIMSRFQGKCTFVAVGDGQEEEAVARKLEFPFWQVLNHNDIIALNKALTLGFL